MPAPTIDDGIEWAVKYILVPSVPLLVGVAIAVELFGEVIAGLIFLAVTIVSAASVYNRANYWNTMYTLGALIIAIVLLPSVPSVVGQLVHPVFGILSSVVILVLFLLLGRRFATKAGFV